ncbi:hypothetical protein J4H54_07915 [Vibrio alginolyticus]|uniref:hypothetical protein n=1 Tax=Vibrio alginolyticus TaxID=663 RepID=UPI001BD415D0|nr:hypothetical protein [Vibrio alginolyticus]MBS9932667.1 hypothetical protein [Vibrio alginolyticus]
MNRDIHHFHRRFNYTSQSVSRLKCESSLKHSLRITATLSDSQAKTKPTKTLEWNEVLSDRNLIWCNSKLSQLDAWSEEARTELLYRIAPVPRIHKQKELQTQRRQYRLKLKKAIISETRKGNVEAAEFLQTVLDTKGHVSYSKIEQFGKLTMQRKKQRIKMLETYLNAHNHVQRRAPTNAVYLQEGILKIPHRWKVGSDIVSLEEYIELTRKFLSHYFPQYPIEAIIGHDDERSHEQNTGCHPHYFLSGRNSETGEYDLHKRQVQVVNEYIHRVYSVDNFFPPDSRLSREESQDFGRFFQKMVKDFANKHLFNAKGLNVVFAPETERQSERRQEMNQEANLPKSERSYNYHTRQLELIQDKVELTEKKHANLLNEQEKVEQLLAQLVDDTGQTQARLSQLQVERDFVQIEVSDLTAETRRLTTLTQELTQALVPRLVEVFKKVLLALNAKDKNMLNKQAEYLEAAFNAAIDLPPSVAQGVSKEIKTIKEASTNFEAEASLDK